MKRLWLLLLPLLFTACVLPGVGATPTATLSPTPRPSATPTVTPSATVTPSPTATFTPLPPTATPTATPTPLVVGPADFPAGVNPLTGLAVSDPALLARRPMAIKIQLYPRQARPPMGLSKADIVFEYYQEGGLTRFNAIFYGQDAELVGPIRSARFIDEHIIRMYHAIFAFGSGDYRVRYRLYNAEYAARLVSEYPAGCPPMCRIEPETWDFLVTNTRDLAAYAQKIGVQNPTPDLHGMFFHSMPPANGEPGQEITLRYSRGDFHRWVYDPARGTYLREQDAANDQGQGETFVPLLDRQTGEQIQAQNVVLLWIPYQYYLHKPEMMELLWSGRGEAVAFRDGQAYLVCWERPGLYNVLTLRWRGTNGCQDAGDLFPFKPGNTFFEIVGVSSPITRQEGRWRVEFTIP